MGSPIAAEVLRRIAELYVIEDRLRGKPAELRAAIRNTESRPLVEALKSYPELFTVILDKFWALAGCPL